MLYSAQKCKQICVDLSGTSALLSSTFPLSRAHIKQWTSEPAISKDQSGWWSRETLLIIYTLSCVAGSPRKSQTHSFISVSNGERFLHLALLSERFFPSLQGEGFGFIRETQRPWFYLLIQNRFQLRRRYLKSICAFPAFCDIMVESGHRRWTAVDIVSQFELKPHIKD